MLNAVIGALVAFAGGVLVSFAGYAITRAAIKNNKASSVTLAAPLRTLLYVAYFAAIYFLSDYLPWGNVPMFVGGALGIVVSMVVFTKLLLDRLKESNEKNKKTDDKTFDDSRDAK